MVACTHAVYKLNKWVLSELKTPSMRERGTGQATDTGPSEHGPSTHPGGTGSAPSATEKYKHDTYGCTLYQHLYRFGTRQIGANVLVVTVTWAQVHVYGWSQTDL
jgi:hypothetical protein